MQILGLDNIQQALTKPHYEAKSVLNQHGIIFFPANKQHRDHKAENISYEDNYIGNALAAMLYPGRIEIRYHKAFADAEVAVLLTTLGTRPELFFILGWLATYQGRTIELQRQHMIEAQLGHLLHAVQPALQPVLDQAFPDDAYPYLRELIDAGEYGIALEGFCTHLVEFGVPIEAEQASRIRSLAAVMQIQSENLMRGISVLTEKTDE